MAQDGIALLLGLVDSGDKGYTEFLNYQFQDSMFKGDEVDLFAYVNSFALKYGGLPARKTIKKWSTFPIPSRESIVEPHKFYYDRMQDRNLKLGLLRAMKGAEELRQNDPQASLTTLTSSILDLNNVARRRKLVNISEEGWNIVNKEFTLAHNPENEMGLRFGWPTFDNMSGGLVGGDVMSIVGRPGMGKTYMALHGMIHAWHAGMSILFVSMEMKVTPIVQRVAAMASNTSISELKAGQVSSKQLGALKLVMTGMNGQQGMWVADGSLSATVEDVRMLTQQLQPDLVIIDGTYLLRHPNTRLQRHDKINTNVEDLKKFVADGSNIPVVETFQLNREAAKKLKQKGPDEVDLEDIAGSDAIGQLSSCVLGLFQEDDVETMLQRKVRIMKGRNGEMGSFLINWRFGGFGKEQVGEKKGQNFDSSNIMNFSEIIPEHVNTDMQFF